MLELKAQIRKEGKKEGLLSAILYGPKIKNISLEIDLKEFEEIFTEAGESSLVALIVEGKKYQVLIHDFQKNPLTSKFIHVDLFQPSLKDKVEASIQLVFEGTSEAVENLEGTLIKNITELEVKALPQDLPHKIKVDITKLKTFEDHIKVSDLEVPDKVEILKDKEEIIVSATPPRKVEEELEKPIEEKVEEVEKVEKEEKEEVEEEKEQS